MARRSKEELVEIVRNYVGDRSDDETISLLEDISDSYDSDGEDWKSKYEENDRSWRKKYMDRFNNNENKGKESHIDDINDVEDKEVEEKTTYEDLFKEED